MAMKKAEMEAHDAAYQSHLDRAYAAERRGMYRVAVDDAVSAWNHVDGMMQYRQRYCEQKDFNSFAAIDLVLKYAPLLLDASRIDQLEQLIDEYKRIERKSSANVSDRIAEARAALWRNHKLWGYLQDHPGAVQTQLRQQWEGDEADWHWVAESWEKMGLLRRRSEGGIHRVELSTRLGEVVAGKCSSCGHIDEAPKAMFLEPMGCPQCNKQVMFVLLAREQHVH